MKRSRSKRVREFLLALIVGPFLGVAWIAAAILIFVVAMVFKLLDAWGLWPDRVKGGRGRLDGGEKAGWTPKEELPPRLAQVRAWMRRLAEPTFLVADPEEGKEGFSKLGGVPELPPDLSWPQGELAPRRLMAQVDLSELPRKNGPEWLPEQGLLYAFEDPERESAADHVIVLYSPAGRGAAVAPEVVPECKQYPEKRIAFLRFKSAPTDDWLGIDHTTLDGEEGDEIIELREQAAGVTQPTFSGVNSRLGGFADEIQGDCLPFSAELQSRGERGYIDWERMHSGEYPQDIVKGSKDWRLLFQFDSDAEVDWAWHDSGMLYVLVRREDAKAGDFSRTVTFLQSY